jgi:hypothetical protein
MTLPYERYNAIKYTEDFLLSLCDPKKTPRVPGNIRRRARSLLRHYPGGYNLDLIATKCPEVLETPAPIDDLSMLMHDYEEKKHVRNNGVS